MWNVEHYGASVREVADGTKNADSAGLNRFPIRPATFARSAAHAGAGRIQCSTRRE